MEKFSFTPQFFLQIAHLPNGEQVIVADGAFSAFLLKIDVAFGIRYS